MGNINKKSKVIFTILVIFQVVIVVLFLRNCHVDTDIAKRITPPCQRSASIGIQGILPESNNVTSSLVKNRNRDNTIYSTVWTSIYNFSGRLFTLHLLGHLF